MQLSSGLKKIDLVNKQKLKNKKMGKSAKAHRAKVAKRNARIKTEQNKMRKDWNNALEKMRENLSSMSGMTDLENSEELDNNPNFVDSAGYTIEDGELPTEK